MIWGFRGWILSYFRDPNDSPNFIIFNQIYLKKQILICLVERILYMSLKFVSSCLGKKLRYWRKAFFSVITDLVATYCYISYIPCIMFIACIRYIPCYKIYTIYRVSTMNKIYGFIFFTYCKLGLNIKFRCFRPLISLIKLQYFPYFLFNYY